MRAHSALSGSAVAPFALGGARAYICAAMKTADFDFSLPPERIAQAPARPRDAARLLDARQPVFIDRTVRELPQLLRPGDLMIFNDTRVIPARLTGLRLVDGALSGSIEVTLHKRLGDDAWRAFARPTRRLKPGDVIVFAATERGDFSATVTAREGGEIDLRFSCGGTGLRAALDAHGVMPLPPYIRRELGGDADRADFADYQTVYARREGAVAAPTAGLHFSGPLLETLLDHGIRLGWLTLHVGAGTFLPVKVENVADHRMHAEIGEVTPALAELVNETKAEGGRIVAVGTTVLRLLESAATADGMLHPYDGETDIFITPGYRFRIVDLLLTNFHLPRSTLFMLVCAFAGIDRMRSAYAHAIAAEYRFYSYGDASLLERAR
jgi:S-adenosylmethionine:tRNA ribosyltransferase-isomerase